MSSPRNPKYRPNPEQPNVTSGTTPSGTPSRKSPQPSAQGTDISLPNLPTPQKQSATHKKTLNAHQETPRTTSSEPKKPSINPVQPAATPPIRPTNNPQGKTPGRRRKPQPIPPGYVKPSGQKPNPPAPPKFYRAASTQSTSRKPADRTPTTKAPRVSFTKKQPPVTTNWALGASRRPQSANSRTPLVGSQVIETEPDTDLDLEQTHSPQRRSPLMGLLTFRWIGSWQFVLLSTVGLVSGAMAFAIMSLFRIPNLPNCRAIFWPTASASLRVQCAESYADQGTVDFLLDAIALVDRLPEDHPLRNDINVRIEEWANQILDLAETAFHAGELDDAISTARKIPASTAAGDVVEGRIRGWQRIWEEGSDTYESAKRQLSQQDFKEAFSFAVRLLDVDNDYWKQVKYAELTELIGLAREDSSKIGKAKQLGKKGSVKAFKEALALLNSIQEESVLHDEAQKVKKDLAKDMLKVAETALERQQLSRAEGILNEIPRNAGFNQEIADFKVFVDAYQQAWSGDALGIDGAITRLQSISRERPLYSRAQRLIGLWRSELQALAKLDEARRIAATGDIDDLKTAIAAAQNISRSNPRWDEASRQIRRWRERVETAEDQPFLTRAEQLANSGTPDALRAAIQEARKVRSGRALSDEANGKISGWNARLQQIEDQPLLDQARRQASGGDVNGAIATASRIRSGRSLYDEAQADVNIWQTQERARQWLQEARQAAAAGTGNGLARAISTARQIPQNNSNYNEATGLINRWSWALLNQAEAAARVNLSQAISLAESIPNQTEAYAAAQLRVRDWKSQQQIQEPVELAPAEPEASPEQDATVAPETNQDAPAPVQTPASEGPQ